MDLTKLTKKELVEYGDSFWLSLNIREKKENLIFQIKEAEEQRELFEEVNDSLKRKNSGEKDSIQVRPLKKKIKHEADIRLNQYNTWKVFAKKVKNHKIKFKNLIINQLKRNGKFFAYGASARSSTLLNYTEIDNKYIDFIIDQNELKDEHYSPGSNVKILKFEKVSKLINKYKHMILLAWNFEREIKKFLLEKKFKGKIIVPFKKK